MGWLSGWGKRKKITLTGGASGVQTDYQVKLAVTYDSDMQVDFDDLRFTKLDGTTLLDAWLESKIDSTSAVVWVETDTPANGVDADIYMYYGNAAAVSDWDGAATFIKFDDGTSLTGWNSPTNFEIDTGWLKHTTATPNFARKNIAINDYIVEGLFKTPLAGNQYLFLQGRKADTDTDTGQNVVGGIGGSNALYSIWKGDGWVLSGSAADILTNTEYAMKLVLNGANVELFVDANQKSATTSRLSTSTASILTGATTGFAANVANQKFDNFRVRKYAANPPTYGFGGEESWLSGWGKRKKITLTGGASGVQTDYQVKLAVTYDSDMQVDFDDLRFTKLDGTTLLDAWLESKIDSTSAVVWVETDTPANGVDADIYMYYGNAAAVSDWDGAATFPLFDGFDSGVSPDTNIWTVTGSPNIAGGIVTLTGSAQSIKSISNFSNDYSMRVKVTNQSCSLNQSALLSWFADTKYNYCLYGNWPTTNVVNVLLDGAGVFSLGHNGAATYLYELQRSGTQCAVYEYQTGSPVLKGTIAGGTSASANVYFGGDGTNNPTISVDWVFVRKYAANPPTYGFGGEESKYGNPYWYYNLLKRRN